MDILQMSTPNTLLLRKLFLFYTHSLNIYKPPICRHNFVIWKFFRFFFKWTNLVVVFLSARVCNFVVAMTHTDGQLTLCKNVQLANL